MSLPTTPAVADAAAQVRMARRRMALAQWLQPALLFVLGAGLAAGALLSVDWLSLLALLAGVIWTLLLVRSARAARRVREAWSAARLGRPDLGEARALDALEAWPILRPVTLGAVHVLALAARDRGHHQQAAVLAGFVLTRRERLLAGDRTGVRLLLAESLLAQEQLASAQVAAAPLYATRLQLEDALRLLELGVRLEARMGAYPSMVDRLPAKVDMAELMPAAESARVQALLGFAAQRTGREDWASWLWRRVSLLSDWEKLRDSEPLLRGVGADFAPLAHKAGANAGHSDEAARAGG